MRTHDTIMCEPDGVRRLPWTVAVTVGLAVSVFVDTASAQTPVFGNLHQMLPTDWEMTHAQASGDVDGDGDPDLLLGGREGSRLYLNAGAGVFRDETATRLPANWWNTEAVVLGDVDGDGDLDLVLGIGWPGCSDGCQGDLNRLYLNDGLGYFTDVSGTHLPADWNDTQALALGDVDGDGDPDLVAGNGAFCDFHGCYPEANRLYLNNGSGVFTDGTPDAGIGAGVGTVALGDVDADSDLDLLTSDALYLNDGAGDFTDATASHLPPAFSAGALVLEDVDADSHPDLATDDALYLNDGAGVFTDVTATHLPPGYAAGSLLPGDVDADGDPDLVTTASLYLNDGAGVFSDAAATHLPPSYGAATLALGDFDGDTDLDVAHAGARDVPNRLYLNDGTGRLIDVTATHLPADVDYTKALVLFDADGDWDLDLAVGNSGQNHLYLNDGRGAFGDTTVTGMPAGHETAQSLALGAADVDGDGDLDLAIGNSGQNHLYLNDGGGVFTDVTSTHLPVDANHTDSLALGDVDGDGDPDLVFGNSGAVDPQNRLYLNDGWGVFSDATATHLPVDSDYTQSLALGDVDRDGDLDLVIGNGYHLSFHPTRLYVNDGSGVFTDVTATQVPADTLDTRAVVLGDVDGDLDLDLVLGNDFAQQKTRLYLNDGHGTFTNATGSHLPTDQHRTRALAMGDVDGDLDPDIVVGNLHEDPKSLLVNDGAGFFSMAPASSLPAGSDNVFALALGDVDGDGDADLVVGNSDSGGQQNRLLTNLTRQLAWRGIPRVGQPLTMDLYGPPHATWVLSLSTIDPPPGGGVGGFQPAVPYRILATDRLDIDGRDSYTIEMSDDPALVGTSWTWRASVGGVDTNVEVTTFTDL